jgi:hypothetical protein
VYTYLFDVYLFDVRVCVCVCACVCVRVRVCACLRGALLFRIVHCLSFFIRQTDQLDSTVRVQ